jgi:hypothetical protein
LTDILIEVGVSGDFFKGGKEFVVFRLEPIKTLVSTEERIDAMAS